MAVLHALPPSPPPAGPGRPPGPPGSRAPAFAVPPGTDAPPPPASLAGRRLRVLDDYVTVLLAQEDTRGQLSLLLLEAQPGSGVPAHRHERESETFLVLEGVLEVEICGTRRRLVAGEAAYLPAGVAHAWFVPGEGPARALVVSTPGGIERMFEELDWLAQRGVDDLAVLGPVAARHGVTPHVPDAVPEGLGEDVRTD